MHKIKLIIYIFILCVSISIKLQSQNIVATPSVGCFPLVGVQFTGLSGASNSQWAFGDGTFSNINNPTHTYSNAGNFVVTYTAVVSGVTSTKSTTVIVYGKPTPNFTLNVSKGCVPLSVSFTDQSINTGGSLTPQWQWSFGDGGVNSIQNPNYAYTIPGTFNVTLIYKDGHGCDSSLTKTGLIQISTKPTVNITNTPTSLNACAAPFTPTFSGSSSSSNSTTGSTALTYNWNLNGTLSSSVNPPPVTFTTTGSFPVTFTCTDNNNCSDSKTVTVNIANPVVKASVKNFACYNQSFTVKDTSVADATQWNFGDGTAAQSVFPPTSLSHIYTTAGIYTITATAFLGATCTSTKTYTVTVEKVTANFTSTPPFGCTSPFVVTYNNTSVGATSYTWNFSGSTVTSTLTSPTHTFTQGSLNPFTIFPAQPLTTSLMVMSLGGCTDNITKTLDTLHRPTAFFFTDVIQGCNPLTVTFTDSSKSTKPIINYTWNFGDGSLVNSSATNTLVTHTYTTPGVFYATLVIENSMGCKDTSFKWPIHVSSPPHTSFSFSPSVVCPYEPVSITNLTPLADSVNHWHVTSDASYFSHCISDANPSWQFSHTGSFPITLSAYSYGCRHDTTLPSHVLVKGPIVSGRYYTRCDSVFKVKFNLLLQDATFAEIRYGDGQQDTVYASGSHTVFHTYATTGNYDAIIKGVNTGTAGCLPNYDTLKVKVKNIKSTITSQSITCAGVSTAYSASSCQDVDAVCGVGYIWLFSNQPPIITDNPNTSFALPAGNQTITLVVKDANGCRDTSKTNVLVSYVNANAIMSNTIGCVPSFSLTGTQSATSNTIITSYSWNFGDGSSSINTPIASHTYTAATPPSTTYNILLTVTNVNGCTGTKNFPVVMNAPFPPNITASPTQLCAGKTVSLSTTATGINTYTWNYGDGSSPNITTNANVTHPYLTGGNYSITLNLADAAGCKANSLPYVIKVQNYPTAIISYTNQNNPSKHNACAGSTVLFSDNSVNTYSPQTRFWNFGTNSGPIVGNQTVGTAYTTSGSYTVSLINCTPFGCCDTTKQNIKVYSASADFSIDKLNICKGEAIKYTIKDSSNVFVWGWDFGDGTVYNLNAQSPISHNYNYHPPGGTTNVSLTYYSSDSACKYSVVKPINIYQVVADFDRNNEVLLIDTAHCVGIGDVFHNVSLNASTSTWSFGDGSTSSNNNPTHTYNAFGTYTVSLSITDNVHNCKDTLKKVMQIFAIPTLTLSGRDTCQNKPTPLQVNGGLTYTWSPSFGLSNPNISNPVATLSTSTLFTVTANSINGCAGTNTLLVTIQEPPIAISWDTTIIIGQTTILPGYAGAGFSYSWTPIDYLSCLTCPLPVSSPTVDYTYTVNVKDTHGCFQRLNTYTVHIEPKSSIDVPTAFTPNGDGVNDLINVDGWGIKKLNYFRVFNRWGELIFETSDLKLGWDGFYKGVPQNMETYVYQAEVETYTDSAPIKKTGYFKLLR